jgi:DNA-binding LytR/AlgR family response regulator
MNVAICDDNLIYCKKTEIQLSSVEFFKDSDYTFFETGAELLKAVEAGSFFDFVFLDVDMPATNGLETGASLNRLSPDAIIIFLSGCPQISIDALELNAAGYLLKGCEQDKFTKTLEKAISRYKKLHSKINLKTGSEISSIQIDDVLYVEYSRKYCYYHTLNNVYSVRKPLFKVLKELKPFGFIQIYQCYVINISKIKKIQSSSVILLDNTELQIKRSSSKELIKVYTNYMNK